MHTQGTKSELNSAAVSQFEEKYNPVSFNGNGLSSPPSWRRFARAQKKDRNIMLQHLKHQFSFSTLIVQYFHAI